MLDQQHFQPLVIAARLVWILAGKILIPYKIHMRNDPIYSVGFLCFKSALHHGAHHLWK